MFLWYPFSLNYMQIYILLVVLYWNILQIIWTHLGLQINDNENHWNFIDIVTKLKIFSNCEFLLKVCKFLQLWCNRGHMSVQQNWSALCMAASPSMQQTLVAPDENYPVDYCSSLTMDFPDCVFCLRIQELDNFVFKYRN